MGEGYCAAALIQSAGDAVPAAAEVAVARPLAAGSFVIGAGLCEEEAETADLRHHRLVARMAVQAVADFAAGAAELRARPRLRRLRSRASYKSCAEW